jgi:hypothetical protein
MVIREKDVQKGTVVLVGGYGGMVWWGFCVVDLCGMVIVVWVGRLVDLFVLCCVLSDCKLLCCCVLIYWG